MLLLNKLERFSIVKSKIIREQFKYIDYLFIFLLVILLILLTNKNNINNRLSSLPNLNGKKINIDQPISQNIKLTNLYTSYNNHNKFYKIKAIYDKNKGFHRIMAIDIPGDINKISLYVHALKNKPTLKFEYYEQEPDAGLIKNYGAAFFDPNDYPIANYFESIRGADIERIEENMYVLNLILDRKSGRGFINISVCDYLMNCQSNQIKDQEIIISAPSGK